MVGGPSLFDPDHESSSIPTCLRTCSSLSASDCRLGKSSPPPSPQHLCARASRGKGDSRLGHPECPYGRSRQSWLSTPPYRPIWAGEVTGAKQCQTECQSRRQGPHGAPVLEEPQRRPHQKKRGPGVPNGTAWIDSSMGPYG